MREPYNGLENIYIHIIDGDGEITINHTSKPQGSTLPLLFLRFGLTFTLNNSSRMLNGMAAPQENYPGRTSGYKIGIYNSTVDDMYVPYIKPQDYGLRTDNRWVK